MTKPGMQTIRFTARLAPDDHGVSSARVFLPEHVLPTLPTRATQDVEGTLDGQAFRSTLVPDGRGGIFLPVDQGLRARAKAEPGQVVEVVLQLRG